MCGVGRCRNSQAQKREPRRPNVRAGRGQVGSAGSGVMVTTVGNSSRYEQVYPGWGAPGDADREEASNQ